MFDKRPHLGLPSWFKRWYTLMMEAVDSTIPHHCFLYKGLYYVFWRITICQFAFCRSRI
jgi:hypothetical protein